MLQVELYGDYRSEAPPPDRLTYTDERGILRKSHVFFIGTAQENAQTVNPADLAASMRDASRYALLSSPFEVCVAH